MEFHWRNAGGQITYGKTLETLPYTTHDEHEIGFWNSDLALAVCKKPKGIEPVKYAPFDGTSGPWVGVGFTDGLTIVTSSHYTVEAGVIFFDHQFVPGMSGGPVFNHHGELVAVVSGYNAKLDIGLACDGPRLQKLLDEYGL
jgi:hypothetical protein